MSDRNRRHIAKARGLGLLVVAAILFAGSAWVWNLGATRIALAQRGYPIAAADCKGSEPCEQDAKVDVRTAATADTALYIALGQLVASLLGLGGVGYTVFYARQAWKEAERSANAAQQALDDTRTETAEQAARFVAQLKVSADAATASAKGAEAMEKVAAAMALSASHVEANMNMIKERTAQQMRAYVTVLVGTAAFQDRGKQTRFEGRPVFLNTGATPAHNVRFKAAAAILSVTSDPSPGFRLDVPELGGATLNSQQTFIASAVVPDYIPDQDVEVTKLAIGRGLVVWGVVTYEDIFGETHETKFGLIYRFLPDGNVFTHYTHGHNEST